MIQVVVEKMHCFEKKNPYRLLLFVHSYRFLFLRSGISEYLSAPFYRVAPPLMRQITLISLLFSKKHISSHFFEFAYPMSVWNRILLLPVFIFFKVAFNTPPPRAKSHYYIPTFLKIHILPSFYRSDLLNPSYPTNTLNRVHWSWLTQTHSTLALEIIK